MNILVLGISGMLGNAIFTEFLKDQNTFNVFGTIRSNHFKKYFSGSESRVLESSAGDLKSVARCLDLVKPDVVINCIGLVKQLDAANDPVQAIAINSLFPHQLNSLCKSCGSRLIHFSTDCVFSGNKGRYVEADTPDCNDLYGRTKLLGEILDSNNAVTLRTSIIGHELEGSHSLLNWFLSQEGSVKGFDRAYFSGLPTSEVARVLKTFILPNKSLHGIYHLSVDRISKFDLLKIIASTYNQDVKITPSQDVIIDRSLDSSLFNQASGYKAPNWDVLIREMFDAHLSFNNLIRQQT
ncbi:SDR family oxidoreductase [Polynucleobacter sp. 15G-AUS-farblos]|uniref:dTDP-4-dehydrorhamnose reductase family protein n=1 Tax=Polynucleobacter sp. 15G-AUS-farblos TaxID=2689094 RepID=UPI001C0D7182|nr:SDR family oxidoreductase [Polynucleobacter sp. 15G-AUS-farblos]